MGNRNNMDSRNSVMNVGNANQPIEYEGSRENAIGEQQTPYGFAYDPKALEHFHKINYVQRQNGHTELASANTLQNSVKMPVNMNTSTQRFKMEYIGSHYANSTHKFSSVGKNVSSTDLCFFSLQKNHNKFIHLIFFSFIGSTQTCCAQKGRNYE